MYPSGDWEGFWEDAAYGRQPMSAFRLNFDGSAVTGHGIDVIGGFTITGDFEPGTGRVRFVKQYLGKHQVVYDGRPDGEGSILGTWTITTRWSGKTWTSQGPFGLRPTLPRVTGEEPIQDLGK